MIMQILGNEFDGYAVSAVETAFSHLRYSSVVND